MPIKIQTILALLLSLVTLNIHGQQSKSNRKILLGSEVHEFSVLKESETADLYFEKTYFWYKNNMIHQTQSGYSGQLLDGRYVVYFLNNDLKLQGSFKKGCKDGVWKEWYSNGKLKEIQTWNCGELHGDHRTFDTSGVVIEYSIYKRNKIHGKVFHFSNGAFNYSERFKNGRKVAVKPRKIDKSKFAVSEDNLLNSDSSKVKQEKKPGKVKQQKDKVNNNVLRGQKNSCWGNILFWRKKKDKKESPQPKEPTN